MSHYDPTDEAFGGQTMSDDYDYMEITHTPVGWRRVDTGSQTLQPLHLDTLLWLEMLPQPWRRYAEAAKEVRVVSQTSGARLAGLHLRLQYREGTHTRWNSVVYPPQDPPEHTPELPEYDLLLDNIPAGAKDGIAIFGAAIIDALLKGSDHRPLTPKVIESVFDKRLKKEKAGR